MPPKYLKRPAPTRLRPCAERMVAVCDSETHAGCCKVPPCRLCLELEVGYEIVTGRADDIGTGWSGTVGGHTFLAYWERNYSGECEYVVKFDDVEVHRSSCSYGASCRDPTGSAEVAVNYYETGILRWEKSDPLELPLIIDPYTGCRTYFCGNCRCSCETLCVTVTKTVDYITSYVKGELVNVSYPCNGPVWEGVVADYALSLQLSRDEYGACVIAATVDGYNVGTFAVSGCADMSATIELEDGTLLDVVCKVCSCERTFPCCPELLTFPETLHLTLLSQNTECACASGTVVPLALTEYALGLAKYVGILQFPCDVNLDPAQQHWYMFTVTCGSNALFAYITMEKMITANDAPTGTDDPRWTTPLGLYQLTEGQCDPFYWRYENAPGGINDAWDGCEDDTMDVPHIWLELTL